MNHLRTDWANRAALQKNSWHEPDSIRGYPLPQGGQFARSQKSLDPDIFDSGEKMHPYLRGSLLGLLGAFWEPIYGEWESWTRIYLAGSLASYWHGQPDFDCLIGINSEAFIKTHPKFAGLSDHEICSHLTEELRTLDAHTTHFTWPPSEDLRKVVDLFSPDYDLSRAYTNTPDTGKEWGPMEVTLYVNAQSWDIRAIRPYAAYNVSDNTWAVHPTQFDKEWGAKQLSWAFWSKCADVADSIKAVLNINDPLEKQLSAQIIYDRIHAQRSEAFSGLGTGVTDPRSLQWVVLNRWGLLGPLEVACHPDRPMGHIPPALAFSKGSDVDTS